MLPKQVVLASSNRGKLAELQQMLAPLGVEVIPQSSLGVAPVEETGLTFVENALLKARHACLHTGLPAIGDDSGIEVDALQGAPGIYSARYAGPDASDEENNRLLLRQLEGRSAGERRARFQCLLVYLRHPEDPTPLICHGTWEGRMLESPRGQDGFGYDPLFLVPDRNQTAAELPAEIKNHLSHRGQALQQLLAALETRA
ncbi:MAG: RdgB/HAM1 family non-canonical purine NTP pyrophosphatase [Nevskiales bacterium]